jgi:hypothetical protein
MRANRIIISDKQNITLTVSSGKTAITTIAVAIYCRAMTLPIP